MSKKYKSPITATITPSNWQDKINLANLSLDDMLALRVDFSTMEKLGHKLSGYMKEVIFARMPKDTPREYDGQRFAVEFVPTSRSNALDDELVGKVFTELGVAPGDIAAKIESCRKPPSEFDTMKVTVKEEG